MDADGVRAAAISKWLTILMMLTGVLLGPVANAAEDSLPAPEAGRPRVVVKIRGPETSPPTPAAERKPAALPGGSGMQLFPPPGTNPPKPGIIVPREFELPPGYLRHNQTTDDGKALPPVLMFHPDYDVVDELGRAVKIPEDRIVPPEIAPPGLQIQTLEVPTSDGVKGRPGGKP